MSLPDTEKYIVNQFHKLYYESYGRTWANTFWLGIPTQKCPLDLWIYQEIIYEGRPDIIIEIGTLFGGSALFLASMCDLVGHGRVITIDIQENENRPLHERILYLTSPSDSVMTMEKIWTMTLGARNVLVILDASHTATHVLRELRIYSQFVTRGSYLIVEDTNINGYPVLPGIGPGPMEAVEAFLHENDDFVVDEEKEKFFLSFNPRGYLRRIA